MVDNKKKASNENDFKILQRNRTIKHKKVYKKKPNDTVASLMNKANKRKESGKNNHFRQFLITDLEGFEPSILRLGVLRPSRLGYKPKNNINL